MSFSIAIDGPSASGKSVLALRIAKHLNMTHINTGSMYRAVAYLSIQENIKLPEELDTLLNLIDTMDLVLGKNQEVYLDKKDITLLLRDEAISLLASDISKIKEVREKLVAKQQAMAEVMDCVMDGRDIGTVVLPKAQVKIFLTASSQVRAMRRYLELKARGVESDYEEILADLILRDYQDSHRKESPLVQAEDAIRIDTSSLSIDQVFEEILDIVIKKKEAMSHD